MWSVIAVCSKTARNTDEYPIAPGGGTSDIDTKYPLAMDDDGTPADVPEGTAHATRCRHPHGESLL
jgi:hypothetical protein